MKTTLDLPEELLAKLRERAARDGREVEQVAAGLPAAALGGLPKTGMQLAPQRSPTIKLPSSEPPCLISIDAQTGLPVIHSPPNAPIHRMTADDMQTIIENSQLEEDLERAGLSDRHYLARAVFLGA